MKNNQHSYSMSEDLKKYPCFFFDILTRKIQNAELMNERNPILFIDYQRHHFIEQTMRKNNLDEYKKFEHLQKMIFVPKEMNYELSSGMSEKRFFEKWGINKFDVIFNKDKYFDGYYN